jgi:hypothetical protein
MSGPSGANVTVRQALQSDVTAILSLLLTSFRQFPLFYTLYSPIQQNLDNARDTLFFWRRRLVLDILDPDCQVIVAQVSAERFPELVQADLLGEDSERSLQMLRWLESDPGVTQRVRREGTETVIVGFAIWRQRNGEAADHTAGEKRLSWTSWAQGRFSSTNSSSEHG